MGIGHLVAKRQGSKLGHFSELVFGVEIHGLGELDLWAQEARYGLLVFWSGLAMAVGKLFSRHVFSSSAFVWALQRIEVRATLAWMVSKTWGWGFGSRVG